MTRIRGCVQMGFGGSGRSGWWRKEMSGYGYIGCWSTSFGSRAWTLKLRYRWTGR
jgi:hypothetical protein